MPYFFRSLLIATLVAGTAGCDAPPPVRSTVPPAAVATPVTIAGNSVPEEAIEAVSPSSAYSRKLHGVFMQPVTCTPSRIRLGDSVDVEIKEAWLEKLWEPKSGGLFGEPNYSRGYAVDSAIEYPRSQLVLAFAPGSRLGHFEQYGWKLALATDTSREHLFSRSRSNQFVMYFLRSNAVFPIKLYVLARLATDSLNERSVVLDSLLLN